MKYTAEDIKNVLTIFAEEFLVDIEAVHNTKGYFIEHNTLAAGLILGKRDWYEAIAEELNIKVDVEALLGGQ